jgi:hypothetical protein
LLATFTVTTELDAGTVDTEVAGALLFVVAPVPVDELQAAAPRAKTARTAVLTRGRDRPSLIVVVPPARSRSPVGIGERWSPRRWRAPAVE